jgi:type II secretory ATPase GspE/PulE/Tfp pilus assembly ATPase PilB-like protein
MTCRISYQPDQVKIDEMVKLFNLRDGQTFSYIHELEVKANEQKVGGDTPMGTDDHTIVQLWKANPDGCDECNHSGYKGRIGIYEVLGVTVPIQKMIVANATSNQIQDQAISEGMTTMQTDGLVKALRGNTTLDEVLRVTRE